MADSKPFSQYLAEAKAKLGTTGTNNGGVDFSGLRSAAPKPGKQDALSWFIDILSRPMRAVQNPINQSLNEIAKQQEAEKTGKPYDFLGGLGNVATAGVRGFFSNNPEDQPAGNQLIEKTADVVSQAQDPNYKNVEDNVNPWVKGIGGFVLDVGLDPTTYIPGAAFAKVGSGIAKVAKGAAAGAVGAAGVVKTSKVAEEAIAKGDVAGRVAADIAAADEASNLAATEKLIQSAETNVAKTTEMGLPKDWWPEDVRQAHLKAVQKAESMATDQKIAEDAIGNASEATKMATAGEKVPLFSENLAAKGDAMAPVREFSQSIQTLKLANQTPPYNPDNLQQKVINWLSKIENQAKKDPNFVVTVPQKTGSKGHGRAVWDAKRILSLRSDISRLSKEATSTSLGNKKQIERMIVTAFKTENPLPRKLSDVLEEIKAPGAVRKKALEDAFGPKVIDQLAKMNEATFIKATDYLAEVLSGKIELANSAKMTTSPEKFVREIMAHNGIEIPTLQSVQNRAESVVLSPETAAIEATLDAGGKVDTAPNLPNVPEGKIGLVTGIIQRFIKKIVDREGYNYETKYGVARTAEEIGAGLGKRLDEVNGMDQLTLYKDLVRDLVDELKTLNYNKNGLRRADEIFTEMRARIADVSKWFDDIGVTLYIGVGDKKVPLNLSQMFVVLNDKAQFALQNVFKMAIGNVDTLVPVTNMMDAVIRVLENPQSTIDEIVAILRQPVRVSEGVEAPPNALLAASGTKRKFGYYPSGSKTVEETVAKSKGLLSIAKNPKSKNGFFVMVDTDKMALELARVIKTSGPDLAVQVNKNVAAALPREIGETKDIPMSILEKLISYIDDPAKLADSIEALSDLKSKLLQTAVRGKATPQAQKNAAGILDGAINPQAVTNSKKAVKAETTLRKADDATLPDAKRQAKSRKAAVKNSAEDIKETEKASKQAIDDAKDPADGFGANGEVVDEIARSTAIFSHILNTNIASLMNPLRRIFIAGAEAARTLPRFLAAKPTWAVGRANYMLELRNIAKTHGAVMPGTDTTYLTQAWRNLASDTYKPANKAKFPELAAAEKALEPVIREVFGLTNNKKALESLFLRSGGTEIDMLAYMKKAGVEFEFDLDLAKRTADDMNISLTEAILSQWGKIFADTDQPLKLLDDIHYAASLMILDKSVAASLLLVPGVTSNVAKKGFGLVPEGLDPLEHPFFAHIPAGTYIDAQYLTEIKRLEEIAMESRTFSGPFGTWLNQTYTPLLNVWKKGVTIYRPGHHTRNFFSDESLQWVAEGNKYYAKSFGAAARVLAAHRAYDDIDWVAILQNLGKDIAQEGPGVAKMPKAGEVLFESPKWGDVTIGRLYAAAESQGLFVEFKQAEDLLDDMVTASKVQKVSAVIGLEGTKIEALAKAVSEGQAHFARLHHFTQILMKEAKSGKKFEDVVEAAAAKVKRHHPDSSMLASGEAKFRQVIPFYTWFRLTLPVLAQGIATQPGRFLVFPKAYYNGAIAMGLNPYSMSDPFPQDQLFPSWIRDQMNGPVGEFNGDYYSVNPGIAYLDVLNQFVPDPTRGVLGMTTPLVKVPAELIGGTNWQTGTKIKDISDYIDSQLPGINYLSNLTGYSTTGSVYGTFTGQGLDQQLGVSKGDKGGPVDSAVTFANWLTGLGIQNMSRQSYIDLAEIEKRNDAARKKAEEEGTARSPF